MIIIWLQFILSLKLSLITLFFWHKLGLDLVLKRLGELKINETYWVRFPLCIEDLLVWRGTHWFHFEIPNIPFLTESRWEFSNILYLRGLEIGNNRLKLFLLCVYIRRCVFVLGSQELNSLVYLVGWFSLPILPFWAVVIF